MYYNVTRYYNPEWGRFLNADDVSYLDPSSINGLNLYAYCGNNPIMRIDPYGNFPFLITLGLILGGIGLVAGGTYAGVKSYNNGARGWDLVGDIAIGSGIGFGIGFTAGVLIGGGISGALTGTFFSNLAGIKVGAQLVYGMYKAAGLAGAGYMMLDNLGNSFHQVTHVFWSGGDLAKMDQN